MKNQQILIVEDDDSIREMYTDALKIAGLEVLTASDGAEGVKMALKHHPRVIMMDIRMPVMDGHQAVKKIREDSWGKNARIIYLTNMSDPDDVVHAIEQKPEEYIVKSNTPIKEVINMVRMSMHK